jgi:hypothetical protein
MKLLQHIVPFLATLAFIDPAVLADDISDSPCVPPSTLETITNTPGSASTTSRSALETVVFSSDTTELSTTETSPKASSETSSETSSEPYASESECQSTDEPSSVSTSTAPVPTTSVVVDMPSGRVNASMLEWTIVWRRCNMPSTVSGFETRKASTTTGLSVSVSSVKSSASPVVQ